jgi:hypothetical protein
MATTQYKDNAGNISEFQQETGDAGGSERRPVSGMPAAVRTQLTDMTSALIALAGTVLSGSLKVVLQASSVVIGKLAPNVGVNIGTVDVASGVFTVSGSLPMGTNHIGSVAVDTPLPAGTNNVGDVDVLTLPTIGQLPATIGAKLGSASLSVVLATDQATQGVSLAVPLPAGTNNIGDVDVLSLPPLPTGSNAIGKLAVNTGINIGTVGLAAGTTNIGDVDVLTLPPLPAGTNNIGDVDIASMPPLPAGANNIGDVDVLTLPLLPQLPATIGQKAMIASTSVVLASDQPVIQTTGTVSLGAALPAGNNNIGDVDIASMPPLPAGNNNIGDVDIASMPPVTLSGSVPAGTNNIGDVDIASMPPLPAGTNAIGKLAANPTVNIGTVDVVQLPTTLGQRNMATSLPVVLPSDQSPVTVRTAGTALLVTDGGSPVQVTGLVTVSNMVPVSIGTSLPPGGNNIGDVDIAGPLPAGTNAIGKLAENAGVNIGTVDILPPNGVMPVTVTNTVSLGPLSAGNANIGDVDVLTLPLLPQLPATIGQKTKALSLSTVLASDQGTLPVSLAALPALPAGTNNIGDVDVLSMPPLPTGSNAIGKLAVNTGVNIGTVGLAAGTTNIGDVDVLTLPVLPQLPPALGHQLISNSLSVVISTDDNNGGAPVLVEVDSLPPLAQLPSSIGQKGLADSLSVVIAGDAPVIVAPRVGKQPTVTAVPASTVVVTLAAADATRVGLIVFNNAASTSPLYLKLGSGASLASWTVPIQPGGYWELPIDFYDGIVTGIWSTAVGDAHVTEIKTNAPPE